MKTVICIPAHVDSKRLARKMLLNETGKYLIQHVYEKAAECLDFVEEVYVCTPNKEIVDIVQSFGGNVILTTRQPNGSLCVASSLNDIKSNICIILQGDSPLINPKDIQILHKFFTNNYYRRRGIYTGHYYGAARDNLHPSKVKMALTSDYRSLYCSRAPIPYGVDHFAIHIGIYTFWTEDLIDIKNQLQGRPLYAYPTDSEDLEQNAWSNLGYNIYSVLMQKSLSIDTLSDYNVFKKLLNDNKV